jgi:hypothetical protein
MAARIGRDRRMDAPMFKRLLNGADQLVLRNSAVPARRPAVFLAAGLGVAFCGGAFSGAGSLGTGLRFAFGAGASGLRLILRNNSAPPPTANSTGHSTRPATPSAPKAKAAAGVE